MIDSDDLKPIKPTAQTSAATHAQVAAGIPIPKVARVSLFSSEDWEAFTEEYGHSLEAQYAKVRRFGGSGDMGIDIACFHSTNGFDGGWDNYQCKRYAGTLVPSDAWLEMGKIIYYSWRSEFPPPKHHFFCASKGISTSLEKLLNKTSDLKDRCREQWGDKCQKGITSKAEIPLEGDLLTYFNAFDFSIFSSKSVADLVHGHSQTPFHTVRFGGGLPARPLGDSPPDEPTADESRYIRQLLDAYGEKESLTFADAASLAGHKLGENFRRQRERFYSAEALRNFARDTVPEGTFEQLQNEIYHGVADECDGNHANGFDRMTEVVKRAASVSSTSNPLMSVTNVPDKQGICHQLANVDRLTWVQKHG